MPILSFKTIVMERNAYLTLGIATIFSAFGILACIKATSIPDDAIGQASVDLTLQLKNIDDYINLGGVIIIRVAPSNTAKSFLAKSNICTNLPCTVNYNRDLKQFICPCDNSLFDQNGNVIGGTATQSLYNYKLKIIGNNLLID